MNFGALHMSSFKLAARMGLIKPSASVGAMNRALILKAEGRDIINLGPGEPDFDTPENIKEAAIAAVQKGHTKYTPVAGIPELRRAIADRKLREDGTNYGIEQVHVSNGAKQVLFGAFLVTVDPEDEVIIPTPSWVSYKDMVLMMGGKPVFAECTLAGGFKLTPKTLEACITERTRWLVFNVPNNPCGTVYSEEEIAQLCEVLRCHPHVWLMTDDIYGCLRFDGLHTAPLKCAPDLVDRTLSVSGVSKAYAMTGWRIGYGVGPPDLIEAMNVAQSQICTCASSIAQHGAIEALQGDQSFIAETIAAYKSRADIALETLKDVSGLNIAAPGGGFFLFAECTGLIGKKTPSGGLIGNDSDLVEYILETTGVILVPGSAFEASDHFRISISVPVEQIRIGCMRIKAACELLR
jgi:aspartate aminotransferase